MRFASFDAALFGRTTSAFPTFRSHTMGLDVQSRAPAAVRPIAAACLCLIAGAATAGEPAPLPSRAGLLVLPNVRVESAAAADQRALRQESLAASGLRAFKDRDTGLLRAPTAEERAEIAAEAPVVQGPVQVLVRANGTKVAMPGESAMTFNVARRTADGQLVEDCVTGPDAASRVLASPAVHREHDHAK